MTNIFHMLAIYQSFLSNKIKKLADPLNTHFGIDEFIYTYISNEGHFFAISNQPEPAEHYFSQHFYQSTLLIRHPDNYRNEALFPTKIPDEDKQTKEHQLIMKDKFGYSADTLLVIFKKEKNAVHKFLFNTKKWDSSIIHFYLNNLETLECFCDYFLKEWQSYLEECEKYTINIAQIIGPNFYKNCNLEFQSEEIRRKESFLKEIGAIPKDFKLPPSFSNQEKICLEWLAQGRTLKETAQLMSLSHRTVEYYFENIKNKMNCMTKSEVLECLNYLKLLGILT